MPKVIEFTKNRKYLDDVMEKLGIDELEEYHYDPLEEGETAVDAKKHFMQLLETAKLWRSRAA